VCAARLETDPLNEQWKEEVNFIFRNSSGHILSVLIDTDKQLEVQKWFYQARSHQISISLVIFS